jgi:hypothetical protein
MAEPWATVLELAAGIAKGVGTDVGIVEEMTRGIHYSKGLTFRTDARFLDPRATLVYDPNYSRTIPVGPPDNLFGAQYYNLEDFMIYLSQFQDVQQCNDNSNLLGGVLLHAVGIPMDPLWLAHNYDLWDTDPNNNDTGDLLVEATYYPAGSTVQQGPLSFRFHQFGFFAGKVYDPSIRPNPMGDPYIGMSLADYLNAAFPGQSGEGYIWRLVTDIRISPGASASWDSGELVSLQGQAEE